MNFSIFAQIKKWSMQFDVHSKIYNDFESFESLLKNGDPMAIPLFLPTDVLISFITDIWIH